MKAGAWCVVGMLVLVGCTADPTPATSEPATSEPITTEPTGRGRPSAEEIVHARDASLQMLSLAVSGHEVAVRSAWGVWRGPQKRRWLAATWSEDGFRTAGYTTGGWEGLWERVHGARTPGTARFDTCGGLGGRLLCLDHRGGRRPVARWTSDDGRHWSPRARLDLAALLPQPLPSLAVDTWAVLGGGDGATLFPFQRVVRSTDGGARWSTIDIPRFGGEMAYLSGAAVLADGRLLVALTNFSDDRRNRPSARHHGLWVSDGDDWSAYRPFRVRLARDQERSPEGWSAVASVSASATADPIVSVVTWDDRAYVSTDQARTFREVRVR